MGSIKVTATSNTTRTKASTARRAGERWLIRPPRERDGGLPPALSARMGLILGLMPRQVPVALYYVSLDFLAPGGFAAGAATARPET
ncbi:MAG: hypothetical protein LBR27_04180 [Bifidobacteriaceae bacterium]|nr:hypothetical protein [Bifidobacteriaceae bacterium]